MAVEHFTPDIDGDENLVQIAALTPTDNAVIIGNGSAWTAESGATLRTSLGLAIGSDVMAYDADLADWAGVNPSSYLTTAAAAAAYQPLDSDLTSIAALATTSYGRGHLTLADAAAGRTYYGLGTAALVADSGLVHISGIETVTGTKTFTATQTKIAPTVGSGADPADAAFVVQAPGAGNSGPYIVLQSTSATPTAGDVWGLRYFGKDSAANDQVYASVNCAIMDPTSASEDSELRFATIVAGTFANRLVIGAGVVVGSPTGGDKGAGTVNATAVYDDNTLLTCYIVEAWKYGAIDLAKWDAIAPNREHPARYETIETGEKDADRKPVTEQRLVKEAYTEVREHAPARGFAKVAADRLDIDKFAQFVWDNERLPAFPAPDRWADMYAGKMATGDLIQRLWETVEVMAVHSIEARKREIALTQRLEALEAAQ